MENVSKGLRHNQPFVERTNDVNRQRRKQEHDGVFDDALPAHLGGPWEFRLKGQSGRKQKVRVGGDFHYRQTRDEKREQTLPPNPNCKVQLLGKFLRSWSFKSGNLFKASAS